MSHNTFGHMFRVTTWGESHGTAIGCTIDGCPPGLDINEAFIQSYLDKRKPGTSKFVTQRREADLVKILSGTFEDEETNGQKTTGTPISLLIENTDQRSKDYGDIKDKFRPGHADYVYYEKYGIRDYRGGGRSSARETAMRVAAGAIARKIIPDVSCRAALVQIGDDKIDYENWDWNIRENNAFWSPDQAAARRWETQLDKARKSGSSLGAIIEVHAENVSVGWGAPVYGKIDADLAAAMMSINAVKGVEIGAGFSAAALSGETNADEMRAGNDGARFTSNNNGGVLGGITTGQTIIVRFVVKPTSSILTPRQTITRQGEDTDILTKGRHDPCVGIRAVPVAEAMMYCVLADHMLRHRAQCG